jgi:hypothetical protein
MRHLAEITPIKSQNLTSFECSVDIFRLYLTVSESFTENRLWRYKGALAEKVTPFKSQASTSYRWCFETFPYLQPFASNSRFFTLFLACMTSLVALRDVTIRIRHLQSIFVYGFLLVFNTCFESILHRSQVLCVFRWSIMAASRFRPLGGY